MSTEKITSYQNEAKFGFAEIVEYLKKLPQNSCVLEIGCGSGFLLNKLKNKFPSLRFIGVEPSNVYFNYSSIQNFKNSFKIIKNNYENIKFDEKFDFIFSVNVLEHTKNEKLILKKIYHDLKKNAESVILCPNYSFPFESHFHIPIIINKKISYFLFKKYITNQEQVRGYKGLWDSINFVRHKSLKNNAIQVGFEVSSDFNITSRMVERLFSDPAFRKRNRIFLLINKFVRLVYIMKILKLKVFKYKLPYMKLILKKF